MAASWQCLLHNITAVRRSRLKIPPIKVVFGDEEIEEIQVRVAEVLRSGMLAQGKYVEEFEERWAAYLMAKHTVAVSTGSGAIEIAMRVLGVRDREVLVPVNTFAATAIGVLYAGGEARFVDSDVRTFSVGLSDLKARRTTKTAGVIVVHVGGIITPQIKEIRNWCAEEGLWLIEDCAHAHGSSREGKRAGTFGIAGCFSFFATKVMTTGEGGMITTNDESFAAEARLLRNHGKPQPWVSFHERLGSNWRMAELNAILGLSQLKQLDAFITWRERIASFYSDWLTQMPGLTPVVPEGRSSWYKYIVLLPEGISREELKRRMKARGVSLAGEVYETPLHRQPIFANQAAGQFPNADYICDRHICLPIYYGMTEEEARFVIDSLGACLKEIPASSR
jgi:perosamine synthetase